MLSTFGKHVATIGCVEVIRPLKQQAHKSWHKVGRGRLRVHNQETARGAGFVDVIDTRYACGRHRQVVTTRTLFFRCAVEDYCTVVARYGSYSGSSFFGRYNL